MLTVPQAARQARRTPETVRRWIRSGQLRASKIGTQHVIEEADLQALLDDAWPVEIPQRWRRDQAGATQPDWEAIVRESRDAH